MARAWTELGGFVVDADQLARNAVEPGTPGQRAVLAEWGGRVAAPGGGIDRAALRDIVFHDAEARRRLEQIVHPEVRRLREQAFRSAAGRGENVAVADIPLLFEAGMEPEFDLVVLVDAPAPERKRRLVELRGLDPDEASRMIASQAPAAEKRARADLVIDNHGTLTELERRAVGVWREIERRAGESAP